MYCDTWRCMESRNGTVSKEIEVHSQHCVEGWLATHGSLRWSSVRFDLFRVDLSSGELFRSGVRVPIQDQPLRLLRLLLEAEGRVVTREQLRAALWPQDTFVDFEHAVNTAVKKLRQALEDSAEHPKFIETLPKIGYRFITALEWVSDVSDKHPLPRVVAIAPPGPVTVTQRLPRREALSGEDKEQGALTYDAVPPETQPEPRIRRRLRGYSILLIAVVLLAGVAFRTVSRTPGAPRVLRFTRLTDDGQEKGGVGALATDGSRIYFNETLTDHRPVIVQVSVTGGDAVPLSMPLKQPRLLDLSREGTEFLIANDDGFESSSLWVLPVVGGSPRRIGTVPITDAKFAADGKSIIYGSEHEVYSVGRDGSSARKLLKADGIPFGFQFSPDGRILRFSEFDPRIDSMSIMEASAEGTGLHQMFQACCGRWTPDGRFFTFQNRIDGRLDLWALPEARRFPWWKRDNKPIQLTAGPLNFQNPLLSTDGKKIFAIGESDRAEIMRYDSRSKQFIPYFSGISAEGLAFSRDGQWVTYTSYPAGTLWRSKVDGSERLQLTFPPLRVLLPRWSPDGKQIAFNARLPDGPFNIYLISSEGGQAQRILPSEQTQEDANWSPDGSSLVFGSDGDVRNKEPIQTIDLGSKRVSALPGSSGFFSPRWSPDGRFIAAMTKDTAFKLMLFDFSSGRWTEVFGSQMGYPSWSHDGKYMYFQSWQDPVKHTGERIVKLRLSDRKADNIVDIKDVGRLTTGTIVAWLGLAPDDSPLFARDISTSEIFALDVDWP
jgi:Tol biopolymer transport system component/DNA-binding winged helix-turn-helix (wHTH) protein